MGFHRFRPVRHWSYQTLVDLKSSTNSYKFHSMLEQGRSHPNMAGGSGGHVGEGKAGLEGVRTARGSSLALSRECLKPI